MSDFDFTLTGSNGDILTLSMGGTGIYQVRSGMTGLGLPATELALVDSLQGSVVNGSRDLARTSQVTIWVYGDGQAAILAARRRLAAALQYRSGAPAKLLFQVPGVGAYTLPVYRQGVLDTTASWQLSNDGFGVWQIILYSPDPYWTAVNPVNLPVFTQPQSITLLPSLALLQLGAGSSVNTITVSNPGDVDAYPVWQITGPVSSVTFTRVADGQTFTLEAIAAGTTITVVTRPLHQTVTDQTGTNRYNLVGQGPQFFSVPAGSSPVSITAAGMTSATLISGYFSPRLLGVL